MSVLAAEDSIDSEDGGDRAGTVLEPHIEQRFRIGLVSSVVSFLSGRSTPAAQDMEQQVKAEDLYDQRAHPEEPTRMVEINPFRGAVGRRNGSPLVHTVVPRLKLLGGREARDGGNEQSCDS